MLTSDAKTKYLAHYPVMLAEVMHLLDLKNNAKYLDCTFGAGGYSKYILANYDSSVIAIDQDPNVKKHADDLSAKYPDKFSFIKSNFIDAANRLNEQFDGIMLDLGVSSMQLDEGDRGFSFQQEAPLDMRMSCEGESAYDFINNASETEIADVIYKYGDETYARKIASRIVASRAGKHISTTLELANIVRSVKKGPRGKIDPATKTFQAVRIHVNKETKVLETFLKNARSLIKIGGVLVVVSFHSLEDSIVKGFFKDNSAKKVATSKYAQKKPENIKEDEWLEVITKKPLVPSESELMQNIRSRSAKLRAARRVI